MDYGDANEIVWLFRKAEMERAGYSTGETQYRLLQIAI